MGQAQPNEFEVFSAFVSKICSVSRSEIKQREEEYKKQVDANPKRRGPKRGSKRKPKSPSASPGPVAS
jgi:hypothetical protein